MQPAVLQCLFFLLWNVTAAKCALGSAVIVAPFWAMIIKPLLQRLCVPAKRKQQQQQQQHATPPPPPTVPSQTSGAAGQRTSASRKSSSPRRGGKASGARKKQASREEPREKDPSSFEAAAATAAAVLQPSTSHTASITNEALASLFRSPEFTSWYSGHRDILLERVHVRCAQRLWESLAVMVALLMGMFLLPFFVLNDGGATLWALLQRRSDSKGYVTTNNGLWNLFFTTVSVHGEPLLILVAVLTLLTTAFMPVDAKQTASTALVAFLVLLVEAAMVEHMALGAGLLMLLGVVAWRVSCTMV
ncbi:putative nuclear transmembrane protein [Trypanosoma cruzi]|uniref:Nuclear transmembrane protein n=2 Tax=Trypanosoma cruzi TaxID=5693 RepID=Q4D3Y5_TRYCC|nr:hypothetical protein, conserved [Trypanosoma cruzi]EAN87241.1 hypothetical protein, conserved [Trypanosoma cruzi]PWV11148.1 putative nuclear transmembrane protein [Trypanosoma cruzi]|eukprot:XP_809092.1 hypothetical protein [Trypanosoma cruzi strain CL Brener]